MVISLNYIKEKKISFLIPTRSRVKSLDTTIESIKKNAFNINNIEIILGVDNDDKETIESYKKNYYLDLNVKLFLLERKKGYTDHAWRFLEMIKVCSGDIFITFADDLVIKTIHWDKILLEKFNLFPKDNLFILFTAHNQINSDWPLIQITTKEWVNITKKFSNCFEADTELMIIGSLLKRLYKIKEINISHNQDYNDKTYLEGRKKVILKKSYIKNSIYNLRSLYLIFNDIEKLKNKIENKKKSNFFINIKIIVFFIPRLIWIYKKFRINFLKIYIKNLLYSF